MDTGQEILLEREGAIAKIIINRPWVRNAFTIAMWEQLGQAVRSLSDDPSLRVLVVQGAGDEAFTSGSDIGEFGNMSHQEVNDSFEVMEEAISRVEDLPIPTIACLNGYALGGGLELALACDLRIASERATLGMPIARLGIMISPKFAKRLVDLIGPSRTKDVLYTGRLIPASEGFKMGLVNYLVLSHELKKATLDLAKKIAGHSASSVRAAKEAVSQCLPRTRVEDLAGPYFVDPGDFPEGVAAFLEKRNPRF